MTHSFGPWHTSDELSFIDQLGLAIQPHCTVARKMELLKGYLKGLERRRVWAGLDAFTIRAHAEKRLSECSKLDPKATL